MPIPGDIVRMKSYYHVEPHITWHFKTVDKKKVAVFLMLGVENKDGTEPIDPEKILNELGWTKNGT